MQLDHQQREHRGDHHGKQGKNRRIALLRLLDGSADLDPIGRFETVADGFERRPDGVGDIRRLDAVDDVGAHRNRHVAVDAPEDRLLVRIFDLCNLRQGNRDAVARIERQVADMREIEPLRGHSAGHDFDFLDAVAHGRDRHTREQHA